MNPADIDRILTDFRAWLEQAPDEPEPTRAPSEPIDLATLVRQFTALRQEVNLQTRASRAQMEQNAQALEKLGLALDELRDASTNEPPEDAEEPGSDEMLRPLLKALVDARDALGLAQRQVARTREALADFKAENGPPRDPAPQISVWKRWFGGGTPAAAAAPVSPAADLIRGYRDTLESIAAGYAMSLQRLDRALEEQGLERLACVGLPFDPEWMEVLEVVKQEGRSGSEVLEEIRPGYRWRAVLFRPAQVRVARP